jgi:hypothetical protein
MVFYVIGGHCVTIGYLGTMARWQARFVPEPYMMGAKPPKKLLKFDVFEPTRLEWEYWQFVHGKRSP